MDDEAQLELTDILTVMGDGALHAASRDGDVTAVLRLLQSGGVDPDGVDGTSTVNTPLLVAARHGHTAVVEALLAHGARVNNFRDRYGHVVWCLKCGPILN